VRILSLVLFGGALVVVSALGARVVAAPVPKHLMKTPEGDKVKLQGKWKVEVMKMGGTDLLGGPNIQMAIEFRGDALTVTADIGGVAQTTTATVKHDTGAGVKRFTTTETRTVDKDGKRAGADEKDESFAYAFDGDKLVLAVHPEGEKTPPVDPLKPGPGDVVLVLTRIKDK